MASCLAKNTLATSEFPYRPLDEPDSIRLIHLLPASSAEAEVRCELVHTTLSNCADIYEHYTALSYVWGNPFHTKKVWVDETPVLVTYNLYSALRDLRHESRALQIWADAICINQQDDEEKFRQISMMGKIYSLADYTVIYLDLFNPQDAAKLDNWVSSNFDESHFSAEIADLVLGHTWFRSVWVFQELIFSKNPRVQVGRYRFPWNTLHRVRNSHVRTKHSVIDPVAVTQGSKLLSEMHKARQKYQRKEETRDESSRFNFGQNATEGSGLMMIDLLRARRGLGVTHP
ncbi:HET-domain-containing protein [Stipitochalara longipes BDJ]|nr:HET-domain-containing protein [Stipitochalara longipes BDJ]